MSECSMDKTDIVNVRATSILRLVEIVLTRLQAIVDTILEKREMLEEYFSLTISEDGLVQRLPQLLSGYTPNLDKLPLFLMRLGPQVCSGDQCLSQRV